MSIYSPSFEQLIAGLVAKDYNVNENITSQLERDYPGQALSHLRAVLQDQAARSENRAGAVRGLGRLKEKQGVPILIAALADGDAEVRKEAARFLAPMRDARAVEPLVTLLNDPRPDVRLAAITPLGRHLFDPRAAGVLLHFLEIAEAEQRPAVLTALSKSDDEQVMSAVIARLKGKHADDLATYIELVLRKDEFAPDPARKVQLLAQLQKQGAIRSMLAELRHADPQVRARPASLLGQLEAPLALHTLTAALQDESVPVRLQAVDALSKLRDDGASEALSMALHDKDTRVLVRCVDALAALHDMRALPGLLIALAHRVVEVRRRAAYALGSYEHPLAASTLLHAITDPDAQVRCNIAYALGRIGDPQADSQVVDALVARLEDTEPEARAQAANALGELGDERAVSPLCRALQDSDPLVIRAVVLALGQLGDSAVSEDLLEILHVASAPPVDRTWQAVQESAIYALGQLGGPQATSALWHLLEQPNQPGHLLCMTIDALEKSSEQYVIEILAVLLDHRNAAVRRRAQQALETWMYVK
ncbi:MAG TPA: HEAT repeat domain-containing protein [Ktedonobacteraceae bacterium]|nr:HEAT repeat domain-containing protein [Ktedonobacteraceae bacterium]